MSAETIGRMVPKDNNREMLCQRIKEISNLAPYIKDYIFEYPNTVSDFYQDGQTIVMEDANFDMDFVFVNRGSVEVILEL